MLLDTVVSKQMASIFALYPNEDFHRRALMGTEDQKQKNQITSNKGAYFDPHPVAPVY
jgi:hypothetical protein